MQSVFGQLGDYVASQAGLLRIRRDQIATDVEDGRIEPGGLAETTAGVHLMDYAFTGVLMIERLPMDSVGLLFLLVVTWLVEHDELRQARKLPWPEVQVLKRGNGLADVVIEADFVDQFCGGPDPAGPIELGGVRYMPEVFDLAVAERGLVDGGPTDV